MDWQGLRIMAPAMRSARRLGFDLHDLRDAITHPETRHPQDVAGRIALSVRRRADYLADQPGRRVHGKAGTTSVDSVKAMTKLLTTHGFEVTPGGSHYRITHPDLPGRRYTPPSDHRWAKNFLTGIRTTFGINLRDH